MRALAFLYLAARKVRRRLLMLLLRPCFRRVGRNFRFDPDGHYTFATISVGDDVFVGPGAYLNSPLSTISIGDGVMIGPDVMMIGGNHNISEAGVPMCEVHHKRPTDDQPIRVESDVWIGARVTILKNVVIGRGSVIAAGSVVTRDVPPFVIAAGVPARVIRARFGEEVSQGRREDAPR